MVGDGEAGDIFDCCFDFFDLIARDDEKGCSIAFGEEEGCLVAFGKKEGCLVAAEGGRYCLAGDGKAGGMFDCCFNLCFVARSMRLPYPRATANQSSSPDLKAIEA